MRCNIRLNQQNGYVKHMKQSVNHTHVLKSVNPSNKLLTRFYQLVHIGPTSQFDWLAKTLAAFNWLDWAACHSDSRGHFSPACHFPVCECHSTWKCDPEWRDVSFFGLGYRQLYVWGAMSCAERWAPSAVGLYLTEEFNMRTLLLSHGIRAVSQVYKVERYNNS